MDLSFYVFAGIGLFGFLFILLTFVLGEFGQMGDLGHVDAGHIEFSHDVPTGDVSADHEVAGHDADGPGPFSTRVLAIFLTTFGIVGAASKAIGYGTLTSTALGLGSGYVLGWAIWKFMRFLWAQEGSSETRMSDLEGCAAEVTVGIPAGGVGQIACIHSDKRTHQIARSEGGVEIPLGTQVRIVRITADGVVVEPAPSERTQIPDEMKGRLHHA